MIYTTNFASINKLPIGTIPIAICAKVPGGYTGEHYRRLAPSYSIFKEWKDSGDDARYTKRFQEEILDHLNHKAVVADLYSLIGYDVEEDNCPDIALVCYEGKDKFCHRHQVRDWLIANNWNCEEW